MHSNSRAPVLSATFRRDSCWITDAHHPGRTLSIAGQRGVSHWRSRLRRSRKRSCSKCTGATEDTARRRAGRPSGHVLSGWGPSLLRGLQHLSQTPVLRLRERTRLDDAHQVADLRLVLLVVGVELHAAPDHLFVALVCAHGLDLDDDRLVHRVRDDDAAALLPASQLLARGFAADDRLPPAGVRAHALRPLPTLRPGDVLLRALTLGRDGLRR